MRAYLVRRVLLTIPTLALVSVLVFFLIRLLPGDTAELMVAENHYAPSVEQLREELGLNQPVALQYWNWISRVVQGDLGRSLWTRKPVVAEFAARWPITAELGLLALLFALTNGILVGVYSAVRQDTVGDYLARSLAIAALALPNFWVATLVVVLPSIWFGWSPALRIIPMAADPLGNLLQFGLPALILGFGLSGIVMRLTRAMALEVLRQDYIRTARAKGLDERAVILRHAAKNFLIPVVTVVGVSIPGLLIGGAVILENIFQLPGMGQLIIEAIGKRDYGMIQGVTLVFAVVVISVNLLVDVSYSYLDPRIRF